MLWMAKREFCGGYIQHNEQSLKMNSQKQVDLTIHFQEESFQKEALCMECAA